MMVYIKQSMKYRAPNNVQKISRACGAQVVRRDGSEHDMKTRSACSTGNPMPTSNLRAKSLLEQKTLT